MYNKFSLLYFLHIICKLFNAFFDIISKRESM